MKHTTKPLCAQLLVWHILVLISVLTLAVLGRHPDSQVVWLIEQPCLTRPSNSPRVTNGRQAARLRREYRLWRYLADSWLQLCLRSWLLAGLWFLTGRRLPALLIAWPWLLWLWRGLAVVWPELAARSGWRRGYWLLWHGQQMVIGSALSLAVSLGLRQMLASPPGFEVWLPRSGDRLTTPPLDRWAASLGCLVCGRQEPWVEVTTETDGSYTATLCGHFTFRIAGDDVFQQRQAMLFLRQLEGPGPQRKGRRTREGRTPFVAQEKLSAWFHIPQPHLSLWEKYWRDKDWANLLSLKTAEVLTGDLVARIVTVFVTFPWWGADKVRNHLQRQGVKVTERQVRQAAEQSGWSQLRQALLKRYELTADSFRPRDNWLVADLLALLHTLLSKLEAGQALTPEEQLSIADLQALAAEIGAVAAPPLKALPWLLCVERVVFGHWQEVTDDSVRCLYCGSTHVVRKSKKPRLKKYYDAAGKLQTVEVYRYTDVIACQVKKCGLQMERWNQDQQEARDIDRRQPQVLPGLSRTQMARSWMTPTQRDRNYLRRGFSTHGSQALRGNEHVNNRTVKGQSSAGSALGDLLQARGGQSKKTALAPRDGRQVRTHTQPVELFPDVLSRALSLPVLVSKAVGMPQQLSGGALRRGVAIHFALGQDVPHGYQELASDSDDGFVLAQARFQPGQLGLPVGMGAARGVGGFHHCGADVAPASLGNPAAVVRQAAVVHPPPEAGVADQVAGGRKARDITDGRQQGYGRDHTDAGQLQEQDTSFVLGGENRHGFFQDVNLAPGKQ